MSNDFSIYKSYEAKREDYVPEAKIFHYLHHRWGWPLKRIDSWYITPHPAFEKQTPKELVDKGSGPALLKWLFDVDERNWMAHPDHRNKDCPVIGCSACRASEWELPKDRKPYKLTKKEIAEIRKGLKDLNKKWSARALNVPPSAVRPDLALIWEKTGFPAFWNIPEGGNTPEECFRKQLQDFKNQLPE